MAKTTKETNINAGEPASPTAAKKATAKKAGAKKATAKKASKKKAVAKKAAPKKAAVKKRAAAGAGAAAKRAVQRISAADRRQMIAEAAYLRGESQGFLSDEREDWLHAEAEVDALLAKADIEVRD